MFQAFEAFMAQKGNWTTEEEVAPGQVPEVTNIEVAEVKKVHFDPEVMELASDNLDPHPDSISME